MTRWFNPAVLALSLICAFYPAHSGHAASAQRITVEARVRAEVEKDLALPYRPPRRRA